MSGVENQGLIFLHYREVVHYQPKLCPIREHLSIPTISNQFFRKLL